MIYKRNHTGNSLQLKISLLAFGLLLLLVVFIVNSSKTYFNNYKRSNLFYEQVINYTLPFVKTTTFTKDALVESGGSIKVQFLKVIGLDLLNPLSLMGKEISYLSTLTATGSKKNPVDTNLDFNSFRLQDNQVSKNSTSIENVNNNTSNLQPSEDNTITPVKVAPIDNTGLIVPLNSEKPEVFIYHTHTSESYQPAKADSRDESENVCAVGDILKSELEKNYGISVVHDKTMHSNSYVDAYSRSGVTVDKYLKQFSDFKLIIDLHRDSVDKKQAVTTRMNNENVAKIMFVLAKNNPHYSKNLQVINELKVISNRLFPSFLRGDTIYESGKGGAFNQTKSNNSILIEVGSQVNTLSEAKNSAKYMARIMAEYIKSKR